jgi:hypothetical protein
MPLSPEAKAALLKRLAEGRAKTKGMREEAKSKGLPDPKPRKPRAKKSKESVDAKEAIPDPLADKPAREGVRPIDGAKEGAVNAVAAMPPSPEENKSSEIDVPNLPDKKGLKKIVDNAEVLPEVKAPKALSTTGRTKKADVNDMIVNQETGNQAITNMMPGQKESIKKMLKVDKNKDRPLTDAPEPNPREKTVESVTKHVPDLKSVEGRQPFSFSAIRKVLYQ